MTNLRSRVILVATFLCVGGPAPSGAAQNSLTAPAIEVVTLRSHAEVGDAKAMYDLGLIYNEGKGVKRDYAEAANWYRRAAAAGNTDAMFRLGVLHNNFGFGVPHDEAQAAVWYNRAANLGHGPSMYMLGILSWNGLGALPMDFVEAYKWLELASSFGPARDRQRSIDARDAVGRAKQMSPQLITLAQKRAREWKAAFDSRKK